MCAMLCLLNLVDYRGVREDEDVLHVAGNTGSSSSVRVSAMEIRDC